MTYESGSKVINSPEEQHDANILGASVKIDMGNGLSAALNHSRKSHDVMRGEMNENARMEDTIEGDTMEDVTHSGIGIAYTMDNVTVGAVPDAGSRCDRLRSYLRTPSPTGRSRKIPPHYHSEVQIGAEVRPLSERGRSPSEERSRDPDCLSPRYRHSARKIALILPDRSPCLRSRPRGTSPTGRVSTESAGMARPGWSLSVSDRLPPPPGAARRKGPSGRLRLLERLGRCPEVENPAWASVQAILHRKSGSLSANFSAVGEIRRAVAIRDETGGNLVLNSEATISSSGSASRAIVICKTGSGTGNVTANMNDGSVTATGTKSHAIIAESPDDVYLRA